MIIFFSVLGVLLLLTLVAYIVSRSRQNETIMKSAVIEIPATVEADQVYYLPAHSLKVKAAALVQITRSADKVIQSGTLLQLSLEPTIEIEPDTSVLVALRYKEDWFSNDSLELGTTVKGLLENISVVAEDRLAQIVAQVAGAVLPTVAASDKRALVRAPKDTVTTEIIEFTRVFDIGVSEAGQEVVRRPWLLPFKGPVAAGVTSIDASFTFRCESNKTKALKLAGTEYDGLLTRPLVEQTWKVEVKGLQEPVTFTCLAPNRHSLVKVPMKRSYFIKREQQPKFSNGLLIQNKIVKPSEAEALIGIPIRIAKAVFSIPAQLFQFKITRLQQETAFAKAQQELTKFQTPQPMSPLPPGGRPPVQAAPADAGLIPPGSTNAVTPDHQGEGASQEQIPPLGKKPATAPSPATRRMSEVRQKIRGLRAAAEAAPLQEAPASHFWTDKFNGPWKPYKNVIGGIRDCVPAAAAHMVSSWTSYTQRTAIEITEDEVIAAYSRESGFNPATGANDDGCTLSTFMDNWISEGVGGRVIRDFVLLRADRDEVKFAIFTFGPCIIGLKMPQTAQIQPQRWQVVAGDATHSADPDTWGGHAVSAVGYDAEGLTVISWGRTLRMDWDFFDKYNDESYAALSVDWLVGEQHSPPPANKPVAELNDTMRTLQLT